MDDRIQTILNVYRGNNILTLQVLVTKMILLLPSTDNKPHPNHFYRILIQQMRAVGLTIDDPSSEEALAFALALLTDDE